MKTSRDSEWLSGVGILKVSPKEPAVRLILGYDFNKYYLWFIRRHYKVDIQSPKGRPHISLMLPKFSKGADISKALKFNNKRVKFNYKNYIFVGGRRRNFRNFYFKVSCPWADWLRKEMGIPRTNELHITLGNTKNIELKPFFPPLIKIEV